MGAPVPKISLTFSLLDLDLAEGELSSFTRVPPPILTVHVNFPAFSPCIEPSGDFRRLFSSS